MRFRLTFGHRIRLAGQLAFATVAFVALLMGAIVSLLRGSLPPWPGLLVAGFFLALAGVEITAQSRTLSTHRDHILDLIDCLGPLPTVGGVDDG